MFLTPRDSICKKKPPNQKELKDKGKLIHVATAAKHWTNQFYQQGF